jgi:hypothetical protein
VKALELEGNRLLNGSQSFRKPLTRLAVSLLDERKSERRATATILPSTHDFQRNNTVSSTKQALAQPDRDLGRLLETIPPTPPFSLDDIASITINTNNQCRGPILENTQKTHYRDSFEVSQELYTSTDRSTIDLTEDDRRRLLEYFISEISGTMFPILEINQHRWRHEILTPALQYNKCYLESCLTIAAQHLKTMNLHGEVDNRIMRLRYQSRSITTLIEALSKDENHTQILQATLTMLYLESLIQNPDPGLPTIPWHEHFQAAASLAQKLELSRIVIESEAIIFDMTLLSWIDILGSVMQGVAPTFAHIYRKKHLSETPSLGLCNLMGCEDRVVYLVSEIACLELLKTGGMDNVELCQHITALGDHTGLTEIDQSAKIPFSSGGMINPKQWSKNITAAFRIAARIYLCSLIPGLSRSDDTFVRLISKLTQILEFIPSGPAGYDRSLVWVYLIAGSFSAADSPFRSFIDERIKALGNLAHIGSFGQLTSLLREVWSHNDGRATDASYTTWREIMKMKGWSFLLI